ncbi:MAG: hypothetical protein HC773_00940 [Scytonema sp. CRU_2_7]|nr:hypothetical protein [Scytonema sp. CRU_2_7]
MTFSYIRSFPPLAPGYIASTDPELVVESGYLDFARTVETPIGKALIRTGLRNKNMPNVVLPTASGNTLYGVLLMNEVARKNTDQTPFTELGQNLINVGRIGRFTVHVSQAFTDVTLPVYVETADNADRGKFRSTTNTGAFLAANAEWQSASYENPFGGGLVAELQLRIR